MNNAKTAVHINEKLKEDIADINNQLREYRKKEQSKLRSNLIEGLRGAGGGRNSATHNNIQSQSRPESGNRKFAWQSLRDVSKDSDDNDPESSIAHQLQVLNAGNTLAAQFKHQQLINNRRPSSSPPQSPFDLNFESPHSPLSSVHNQEKRNLGTDCSNSPKNSLCQTDSNNLSVSLFQSISETHFDRNAITTPVSGGRESGPSSPRSTIPEDVLFFDKGKQVEVKDLTPSETSSEERRLTDYDNNLPRFGLRSNNVTNGTNLNSEDNYDIDSDLDHRSQSSPGSGGSTRQAVLPYTLLLSRSTNADSALKNALAMPFYLRDMLGYCLSTIRFTRVAVMKNITTKPKEGDSDSNSLQKPAPKARVTETLHSGIPGIGSVTLSGASNKSLTLSLTSPKGLTNRNSNNNNSSSDTDPKFNKFNNNNNILSYIYSMEIIRDAGTTTPLDIFISSREVDARTGAWGEYMWWSMGVVEKPKVLPLSSTNVLEPNFYCSMWFKRVEGV